MAQIDYGLGKGLREPCSPFRRADVFGAPLNTPNADSWNCLPEIINRASSFDVSTLRSGQEVVVGLINLRDIPEGRLNFKIEWFRNRDGALLYTFGYSAETIEEGWIYVYSYVGLVPWEISEDGDYRVEFTVSGALSLHRTIEFNVLGISEEREPAPVPTGAIGWISERFAAASAFFYQAYLEALEWVYPFWLVADFFYALSEVFINLAHDFNSFNIWVEEITAKVLGILDWNTIWTLILTWIPNLEDIQTWFYSWWSYVYGVVGEWWTAIMVDVKGWIEVAKQELESLIDDVRVGLAGLNSQIDDLRALIPNFGDIQEWFKDWAGALNKAIGEWWTGALPDVQGLIDSSLRSWFPFYDDLGSLWEGIKEFFTDPEDWLYKSADRIIERFW